MIDEQTWHSYRSELNKFILLKIKDPDSAEDIVQEVLIRAHLNRDKLKDSNKLRGWLYSITKNTIADYYRLKWSISPFRETLPNEIEDRTIEIIAPLADCMAQLIYKLPAGYAEALTLSDLDGIPQGEIAKLTGLSLSGTKSRIQRARVMLKKVVLACCRVEFDHLGRITNFDAPRRCIVRDDYNPGKMQCD